MATTRANDTAEIKMSTGNRSGHGWRGLRWAIVGVILGVVAVIWGISTRDDAPGVVQDMVAGVKSRFEDARLSVHNQGLASKVKDRIQADKNLISDKIEVNVEDEATVILKGEVPDQEGIDKAVELARDTRGVRKIIDKLTLPPKARVIVAPPAADAPDAADIAARSRSVQ